MKILLLQDIKNLGRKGDIKEVTEGYANNYLIPKGLGDTVTKHVINQALAQKKKKERVMKREENNKNFLIKKIKNKIFHIHANADNSGSLYAKISVNQIAEELKKNNWQISAKEILSKESIKKIGEYNIKLRFGKNESSMKLIVSKE